MSQIQTLLGRLPSIRGPETKCQKEAEFCPLPRGLPHAEGQAWLGAEAQIREQQKIPNSRRQSERNYACLAVMTFGALGERED